MAEQPTTTRVKATLWPHHHAELPLVELEQRLVLPISALLVVPLGAVVELELAADRADLRVRKVADQLLHCAGIDQRVRVRQYDDLARSRGDAPVEHRGLAAATRVRQPDAAIAKGSDDLIRPVGRTVRADDHLESRRGIIDGNAVLQLLGDAARLAICGDDHGDGSIETLSA